jgi:hypothetical protein
MQDLVAAAVLNGFGHARIVFDDRSAIKSAGMRLHTASSTTTDLSRQHASRSSQHGLASRRRILRCRLHRHRYCDDSGIGAYSVPYVVLWLPMTRPNARVASLRSRSAIRQNGRNTQRPWNSKCLDGACCSRSSIGLRDKDPCRFKPLSQIEVRLFVFGNLLR